MFFVNGHGKMYYELHGTGTRSVLLIHGFPLSSAMWRPQIDPLVQAGFSVITVDLPGFGRSDITSEIGSIDSLAMVIGELLDHLQIKKAAIGGMSMGGYVTLALYAQRPELFEKLMLIVTRAEADSEEAQESRTKLADQVGHNGVKAAADVFIRKLLGSETDKYLEKHLYHDIMMRASVSGTVQNLLAMRDRPDRLALLPTITVPTLVICGAEDNAIPPSASEAMAKQIPSAKLVKIPATGHICNMEDPASFNRALLAFL